MTCLKTKPVSVVVFLVFGVCVMVCVLSQTNPERGCNDYHVLQTLHTFRMSESELSGSFMPPELEELHTVSARLTRKRVQEKHRIMKLEVMKTQLTTELATLRQACGRAPTGRSSSAPPSAKHVLRLENRLEQKQMKLSEAGLVNVKLRGKINGETRTALRCPSHLFAVCAAAPRRAPALVVESSVASRSVNTTLHWRVVVSHVCFPTQNARV